MGSDVIVAATQRRGWRSARTRVLLASMLAFLIAGVSGSAHLALNNPSFIGDATQDPANQDPAAQDPAAQDPAAQAAAQATEGAVSAPAPGDNDNDGMPDAWETFFGLNPASGADAAGDPDNDGLTNLQEFQKAGHPFGAFKRFFAEGATGFFDTYFGIVNLHATDDAHVQLTFMGESGVIGTHQLTIPAGQRRTVSADTVLGNGPNTVLGTVIESDKAMVADRLIRWGGNGYGSSVDAGAAAPSNTWYLAEGSTGLFQLYYLLLNPGLTPANVTVKYLREGGGPITKNYTVPAQSRTSVFVNLADAGLIVSSVGAAITSDKPIVAERAMYFSVHQVFGAGTGAMGSPQLATQWLFAESSTGPFFDEFVSLLNPSTTQTATATLTFHLPGGSTLTRSYTVAPERRRTVYLNLEALLDPGLAALQNATFWMTVDSDIPIASERVMWWPRGTLWYEGHASTGSTAANTSWVVPEGSAGNAGPGSGGASDQTYLLIANTSNAAGQVRLTLIPDAGANSTATLPIGPNERLSVNVAAQFGINNTKFSVLVDSLGTPGVPIVVDYARYASPGSVTWAAGGASQAIIAPAQTPADTAPTVTATTPANGATNVLLHGNLTVTFSESVSVTPTAFTLQCPVPTPIALTNLTASPGTTFTLDPNVPLPQNTICTLTVVATQVTDTDANDPPNTMAANHVITFTTETESAPTVTATTPANLATGVTVASNLTVTFSEPVNVTAGTFVLECPGGTPIALTNTTGSPSTTFTLDPNVNLPYATSCTVTVVASTVTDVDSNDPPDNMAANFVFSFTTESCPTVTVTPTSLPGASTGTPYSQIFSQTGLTGTVVWSLTGTLPTGVTFNTATGELSGTPTQAGSFPITVTATGAGGCFGSVAVTLSVNCPVITVSPNSLPAGTTGTPYSQLFTQLGASGAITWSLSGTLPTGMTFNTATGELSGTPTQTGSFPVSVTATDANGCSGFVAVTLTVNCPVITVSPSSVPAGTTGTPYSQIFTQVGASGTITWSLTGALPTGVTFNTATGELSGTPTQTGSFPVTVTATDANGCSGAVSVTLTVNCPTITIGPASLPNGTTGTTYPATQLTQAGGTLPITWDLASGTLPTGLSLSGSGLVSGTPTAAGSFNFTARATDANGCSGTLAYSVNIVCPTITVTTTGAVPNGVVGVVYGGVTFQQTGGSTPITWSVSAGSLPAGLALNSSTGQITGTPTQTGTFVVTVTATDANGCTGSLQISFTVTCPVITLTPAGPTLADGFFGVAYSQTFLASGGATPHTFTVTSGALPPNMTLSSGGSLTGSPSNTGPYSFTITATDNSSAACAGSAAYQVTVRPNAQNDSYNSAVGNTDLLVDPTPVAETTPRVEISGTVLSNDAGPATLTAVAGTFGTTAGGSVTLASDGTFLYRPLVGFTGPSDTFQYTLTDGNGITSNTATVTIGVANIVWYVDSSVGVNGDGRSFSPFNTLASANTASTVNHHVFVHSGGATTPGDITLESGQVLHGHGSAFSVGLLTLGAAAHPTLSGSVTLGPNTTVNTLTMNGTGSKLIGTSATTGTVAITGVNITGGTTGLSLTNVPATVTVTGGAFSGISGTDVHVNDGSGVVSIGATITNTAGRSVHIQNRDGGSVTFTGAINDTGTGIRLESNNAAHTTHFNGGLAISSGANIGLHATSGGIVNVTGAANTITTGAAAALHVQDTTIGANGMTFLSLSANGAANGIVLNNTGATAGLTVTGAAAANSGGTIQNTTSHGVLMTSTTSPSFTRFRIMNTGGSGVKGTGVNHFTFVNGAISGSNDDGTALANESNIAFHDAVSGTENNLSGNVTITGNSLTTALYHGIDILNHAGTITSANISGNTITSSTSGALSQGSGIRFTGWGSAGTAAQVTNANITNNTITNFPVGAGILVFGGNNNNALAPATTMGQAGNGSAIVNITGNSIAGQSSANPMNTFAIQVSVSGVGQGNFNISNNGTVGSPLTNIGGNVISHSALGLANVTSVISNNVIVANHGIGGAFGISVGAGQVFAGTDNATLTTTISGNTISQTDGNGIIASAREASANLVARILNNNVAAPLNGVRPGIRVDSGNTSGAVDNSVCLEISGNTSAGSGGSQGIGLRKQGTSTTVHTFAVEGMAATASPGVETFVSGQNPAGNGTLLISASSGFASCTAP